MDDRISYLKRLHNLDWNVPRRGLSPPPDLPRWRALEEKVFVLKALLLVVAAYLVSLSLPENSDWMPLEQLPANSVTVPWLGPLAVGGLLFWAGVGFLAGRLWWPAYFCGLLALTLSALSSLPLIEGLSLGALLRLAAMGMLVGAAGIGGGRFRRQDSR